jgi:plastocyanin
LPAVALPPDITSVGLSPNNPLRDETLTTNVQASDPDGDSFDLTYAWFRNGGQIPGENGAQLNLNNVPEVPNDIIRVEVTATDVNSESSVASESVTIGNRLPSATVSITCSGAGGCPPRTDDVLTANATKSDPDGDPVSLSIDWFIGQTKVGTGDTLNLASVGKKGDTVRVEVTPNDGFDNGPAANDSVTVQNTPPRIGSISLTPQNPRTDATVTADVTVIDADQVDFPHQIDYQWTRNGSPIAGETGRTLDLSKAGNGNKGDSIRVQVTVSDGDASDGPTPSQAIEIVNAAPSVTVGLSPKPVTQNATLTTSTNTSDLDDGDNVSLRFAWFRNGKKIAGVAGKTLSLATLTAVRPGDIIKVEVIPNDGTIDGSTASDSSNVIGASKVVRVSNYKFRPTPVLGLRGDVVRWAFKEGTHGVRDSTGLRLFETRNPRLPGSKFTHSYTVAGTYTFKCTVHSWRMVGRAKVAIKAYPKSGRTSTAFSLSWASVVPGGYVVDIQIARPDNPNRWVKWRRGRTTRGATFYPAGKGVYKFRARMRSVKNGSTSDWSPPRKITVN